MITRRNISGFTVIELMVTITVLGVLVALSGPGFSDLMKNNRMAAQTNDLMSVIAFSRAEAMRRGARITICPSVNGSDCTGGSDWQNGVIAFVDTNRDAVVNPGEEVLRNIDAISAGNTISATGITSSLQFRGSGVAIPSGTLKLCDDRPNRGRLISVAVSGSTLLTKDVSCP